MIGGWSAGKCIYNNYARVHSMNEEDGWKASIQGFVSDVVFLGQGFAKWGTVGWMPLFSSWQPYASKPQVSSMVLYLRVCWFQCKWFNVYLSVCLSVCLPAYLFISLSVCLYVCLSAKVLTRILTKVGSKKLKTNKHLLFRNNLHASKIQMIFYPILCLCLRSNKNSASEMTET